jgi:hypothetical protein
MEGVFIGFLLIPAIVFVIAVIVPGYRFSQGYGPLNSVLWFFLTLFLGGVVRMILFMLYASIYYSGGGH